MATRIANKSKTVSSAPREKSVFTFLEFFAGGGMVRAGLGDGWRCLFANDFDPKKAAAYINNWGDGEIYVGDVRNVREDQLPQSSPDLAWASFPCQDLSLAGAGAGLKGDRSGSFWPFWERMTELCASGRAPKMIVLENVAGTLSSHNGTDFESIIEAFVELGYDVGAMTIDAQLFVPQSRQRLFFVAVPRGDAPRQLSLLSDEDEAWRSAALKRAYNELPQRLQKHWIWWSMPLPPVRNTRFADIIEDAPADVSWHTPKETQKLIGMMSSKNLAKVEEAKLAGRRMVGGMYRRTRTENGKSVQRVEVRFDDVSGCLRTPGGGSSRQTIFVVDGETVRSRLISARETARLMGLPDGYKLPARYNDAYHLTGDGVVVNVIKYLAEKVLEPHLKRVAAEKARTPKQKPKAPPKPKATATKARDSAAKKTSAKKPVKGKSPKKAKKAKTTRRSKSAKPRTGASRSRKRAA
ncbi:MAG: DNA cytosine methyltransferase [Hyphomonadaceae bacterium]|nr:DNA cytosine methyltransferase [Hyphomonadaceae bacterium]